MRDTPLFRSAPFAAAATIALCVGGCGGSGSAEHSALPSRDTAALADSPAATFDLTIDELAAVLPKAFEAIHWGQLRITNEVTAMRAAAVTEDDRNVEIHAQKTADGKTAVQIRVGFFGDEKSERRFLQLLGEQTDSWKKKQISH